MLENFLDSLEGAEWKITNIKSRRWKNCMPFVYESSLKGTLGFSIYLNSRKKLLRTCVWKMWF